MLAMVSNFIVVVQLYWGGPERPAGFRHQSKLELGATHGMQARLSAPLMLSPRNDVTYLGGRVN